jgi:hypothetical protein
MADLWEALKNWWNPPFSYPIQGVAQDRYTHTPMLWLGNSQYDSSLSATAHYNPETFHNAQSSWPVGQTGIPSSQQGYITFNQARPGQELRSERHHEIVHAATYNDLQDPKVTAKVFAALPKEVKEQTKQFWPYTQKDPVALAIEGTAHYLTSELFDDTEGIRASRQKLVEAFPKQTQEILNHILDWPQTYQSEQIAK